MFHKLPNLFLFHIVFECPQTAPTALLLTSFIHQKCIMKTICTYTIEFALKMHCAYIVTWENSQFVTQLRALFICQFKQNFKSICENPSKEWFNFKLDTRDSIVEELFKLAQIDQVFPKMSVHWLLSFRKDLKVLSNQFTQPGIDQLTFLWVTLETSAKTTIIITIIH